MSINISDDNYEDQASQEEQYLEETVEEVRAILTPDDQVSSQAKAEYWQRKIEALELDWEVSDSMTNADPRPVDNPDERLVDAVEDLITGDSDDPPLSEETVEGMLRDSRARGSDR
jgi:hypothetical protein